MKIAVLLVVALAACGGSDEPDDSFMPPDVPSITTPAPIGTITSLGNLDVERVDTSNTFVEFAGKAYFGSNGPSGPALFATDGTPAGTHVVASRPSWQGQPTPLRAFRSTLMFTVSDAYLGTELWVSDGTDAGTQVLVDSVPGAQSGGFNFIYDASATTLYYAITTPSGQRLWRTDGTPAGTSQVTDLDLDTNFGSRGGRGSVLGDHLLFAAITPTNGSELWTTDGTAAGTHLVKDINPGTPGSQLGALTALGSKAVFFANGGTSGTELWSTDGTAINTVLIKDINPGAPSSASVLVAHIGYGGSMYFSANDGSTGFELWRTDGTAANTTLVKDISPGVGGSSPSSFVLFGSKLLFVADDGTHGREPFVSDGTAGNTVLLADINPGTASSGVGAYATLAGSALFRASDATTGAELWTTNGTPGGTTRVADLLPGLANGVDTNPSAAIGRVFFSGRAAAGTITYVSDGTAAGTVDLGPLAPNQDGSSVAGYGFETLPTGVVFAARDAAHGGELWIKPVGGTAPQLIKDINPGFADGVSFYSRPLAVGARAFFLADDGIHGSELWVTDGTGAGTALVKDISAGATSCSCQLYATHAGKVYFGATDGTNPYQLWISDGTALGTTAISGAAALTSLTAVGEYNGHVLFGGSDTSLGAGLYTVLDNGTVTRLTPQMNSYVSAIGAVPGTVFVSTFSLGSGGVNGMFRTDGTIAGTVLATTTHAPQGWFATGGKIGFVESGSYYATIDGTDATTMLLGRLVGSYTPPTLPAELGGALYFLGGNGTDGRGLYRTDLTPQGTQLVREVPFTVFAGERIVASGGLLVFVGGDPAHGFELWASDGTTNGTARVADVNPGPDSSSTSSLFPVGTSDVYFDANDGAHGLEPWKFSH
ncbi:MAG TPA: ELWxxDGT repeat protein [Kofleriaceae bacterium]|jgi:ELWxxDGT repeat protein